MPIIDEKSIWTDAHEVAEREIERIRTGEWGGGHEPHPGLAAAIANLATHHVYAERNRTLKIAASLMPTSQYEAFKLKLSNFN